jgi:hypothetical protein
MNDIQDYENETYDAADLENLNIKINPDFYLHKALLNVQLVLAKDDVKIGFLQFRVLVKHIESLAKAAKMVDDTNYYKPMKKYKESDEIAKETDESKKSFKIAEKQFEYLAEIIFANKTATAPLAYTPKKEYS